MEELQQRLQEQKQVLCIVNTRKMAQNLYRDMQGEGTYCLTTLLCPADRKAKFKEIKDRLQADKICRVIATSLLEAGVDLDFPQVYRQEAGLDSLIQAAGRCNREGKDLSGERIVYSYCLENERNKQFSQKISALNETWRRYENVDEPQAISFYFQYYRELLGGENLDQKEIMKMWEKGDKGGFFPFEKVSRDFHLIENSARIIYISRDETEELLKQVADFCVDRNTFRKLGQYGVNVYEDHFARLMEAGCLEEISKEVFALRDDHQYSRDTGLQMDVETGFGIMA